MGLLKKREDHQAGDWFEYGKDDAGRVVSFQIRAIPDSEVKRIDARHNGKHQKVRIEKGAQVVDWEAERGFSIVIDQAAYSLVNSRNFYGQPADAESAETYTRLLGEPITPDTEMLFDNRLPKSVELREHVLRQAAEFMDLPTWINTCAQSLRQQGRQKEEALKS